MRLHREGHATLLLMIAFTSFVTYASWIWTAIPVATILSLASLLLLGLILWFFRIPKRTPHRDASAVLAPADGKIVAIEEVHEAEHFNDRRRQVSIFMSPLNVHVNWYPISGSVSYVKYHPGRYLVAWHPKSSTENERNTVVIRGVNGEILIRQIAGALARRICTYAGPGAGVEQGSELGFIKFGSRVDVLLPLSAEVLVALGQHVQGINTIIARTYQPTP